MERIVKLVMGLILVSMVGFHVYCSRPVDDCIDRMESAGDRCIGDCPGGIIADRVCFGDCITARDRWIDNLCFGHDVSELPLYSTIPDGGPSKDVRALMEWFKARYLDRR